MRVRCAARREQQCNVADGVGKLPLGSSYTTDNGSETWRLIAGAGRAAAVRDSSAAWFDRLTPIGNTRQSAIQYW